MASQARDYSSRKSRKRKRGLGGHAEVYPPLREVLNRPEEPTSGTLYKEHDLSMCRSSVLDSEGPGDVIILHFTA